MNDGRLLVLLGLAGVVGASMVVRGSRGVVRRGRGVSPAVLAGQIRRRVEEALARLRDDDFGSIQDALDLLTFTKAIPSDRWQGHGFPSATEDEVVTAFKIEFPKFGRKAIQRGYELLTEEGFDGRVKAIVELRHALLLDSNFEAQK